MGDIGVLMDFYVVCGNEVAFFVFFFFRLLNGVWGVLWDFYVVFGNGVALFVFLEMNI